MVPVSPSKLFIWVFKLGLLSTRILATTMPPVAPEQSALNWPVTNTSWEELPTTSSETVETATLVLGGTPMGFELLSVVVLLMTFFPSCQRARRIIEAWEGNVQVTLPQTGCQTRTD